MQKNNLSIKGREQPIFLKHHDNEGDDVCEDSDLQINPTS
jgi:hypothetical protein